MRIKDIMSTQVQRIHQTASVHEAAEKMKTVDVGMIPVYDRDRLVGALTDRDIVIRGIAERRDPRSTRISDVMSRGVSYCFENQDESEAARIMSDRQIRRLVVLNKNKRLVGILSLGDLATRSKAKQTAASALENVSKVAS